MNKDDFNNKLNVIEQTAVNNGYYRQPSQVVPILNKDLINITHIKLW